MANIKSIGGNPIVLDASGIADGAVTPDKLADMGDLTAGAALGITGEATESAAWLERISTSDGPTTAKSIHGRTLRWNQLVSDSDTSVTVPSGHKYAARIDGTTTLATSDGTAITVTGGTDNVFDLTAMFGAGNEPSTVAEFEALFPEPYYEYDAGSLLSVNMEGIETVGFNQWDEEWEVGAIDGTTGQNVSSSGIIRSKNYIPVFPGVTYYFKCGFHPGQASNPALRFYDADKNFIGIYAASGAITPTNSAFTVPDNAHYLRFNMQATYGNVYRNDICINLSWSGRRNGEYEAFWKSQRLIDVASYFPNGMRSAGSVYDELTSTEAITRIGERAYQSGDESDATVVTDGTITHYALTTPSTVEIDPPLNLTYRTEQGGTERVMVPEDEQSAPPTLVTAQGYTAESLRDAALATIAPIENHKASANYAIGSYLVHGGQLCKVTTAIATGEAITIGTNVVTTTVMAEVLSLTQ